MLLNVVVHWDSVKTFTQKYARSLIFAFKTYFLNSSVPCEKYFHERVKTAVGPAILKNEFVVFLENNFRRKKNWNLSAVLASTYANVHDDTVQKGEWAQRSTKERMKTKKQEC